METHGTLKKAYHVLYYSSQSPEESCVVLEIDAQGSLRDMGGFLKFKQREGFSNVFEANSHTSLHGIELYPANPLYVEILNDQTVRIVKQPLGGDVALESITEDEARRRATLSEDIRRRTRCVVRVNPGNNDLGTNLFKHSVWNW